MPKPWQGILRTPSWPPIELSLTSIVPPSPTNLRQAWPESRGHSDTLLSDSSLPQEGEISAPRLFRPSALQGCQATPFHSKQGMKSRGTEKSDRCLHDNIEGSRADWPLCGNPRRDHGSRLRPGSQSSDLHRWLGQRRSTGALLQRGMAGVRHPREAVGIRHDARGSWVSGNPGER